MREIVVSNDILKIWTLNHFNLIIMWHKIVIICSITVLVSIQDGVELHCVRLCRYAKQKTPVVHRNLQFKHKTRNTCLGWRDEAADGGCVETMQYYWPAGWAVEAALCGLYQRIFWWILWLIFYLSSSTEAHVLLNACLQLKLDIYEC